MVEDIIIFIFFFCYLQSYQLMSQNKGKTESGDKAIEILSNSESHESEEDHFAPTGLPKKQQQHDQTKNIQKEIHDSNREADHSRQTRNIQLNNPSRQKNKKKNKKNAPDTKDMVKKQQRKIKAAPPQIYTQSSKSKSQSHTSSDKQQAAPQQPKQSPTLYIGNLPLELNQSQIRKLFKKYGSLKSVKLMINTTTGKSKGFGFVSYWDMQSAIKAKYQLCSHILDGLKITIQFCQSQ